MQIVLDLVLILHRKFQFCAEFLAERFSTTEDASAGGFQYGRDSDDSIRFWERQDCTSIMPTPTTRSTVAQHAGINIIIYRVVPLRCCIVFASNTTPVTATIETRDRRSTRSLHHASQTLQSTLVHCMTVEHDGRLPTFTRINLCICVVTRLACGSGRLKPTRSQRGGRHVAMHLGTQRMYFFETGNGTMTENQRKMKYVRISHANVL